MVLVTFVQHTKISFPKSEREEIEQQTDETDELVSEEQDPNISDESDEVTAGDVAQRFKSRNDMIGWSSETHDVHGGCCDESSELDAVVSKISSL